MSTLVGRAAAFARERHKAQVRKYTGNPYTDHLAEVVGWTATADTRQEVLAVAWLHDVIEDQAVPVAILEHHFGPTVAKGVYLLSDLERGTRAERKALARTRLAVAPDWVQTIKCADIVSNMASLWLHDPQCAIRTVQEKEALLDVLIHADPGLRALAMEQCAL